MGPAGYYRVAMESKRPAPAAAREGASLMERVAAFADEPPQAKAGSLAPWVVGGLLLALAIGSRR